MSSATLIAEASDLDRRSISRAREIDFATAGSELGPIVEQGLEQHRGRFNQLRGAVLAQLERLGERGEKRGLFMLAADMAMTAELEGDRLSRSDRHSLRQLWDHLRLGSR